MNNNDFISSISYYIVQFLTYSKPQLAENSYEHRYSQLREFDHFLYDIGFSGTNLDEKTVNMWIHSLSSLADSTVMTYVVSVRKLFEYLSSIYGFYCYMPHIKKVNDIYAAHYFTEEENVNIFNCADDYPCGANNPLPYIKAELPMILRILESCGTRITETLRLQMKHINLGGGVITVVHSKRGKERVVPMSHSLAIMLKKYCMAMGLISKPESYVFPKTDFDTPLERHDIENRFSNILHWNNFPRPEKKFSRGICPHCFRHNFTLNAFKKLEANGIHLNDAIPYLSIYLGHESLQETEKYLLFSAEMFPDELHVFDDTSHGLFPDDGIWLDKFGEVIV